MPKLASTVSTSAERAASEVLELIAEFQRCARAAVGGLRRQSGTTDLLRAWRSGRLTRSGRLLDPRGRYTFHGVGCRFEIAGRIIDVDFGPRGRHDGFDLWKLQQFAESSFEWEHLDDQAIQDGMRRCEVTGVVVNPKLAPSPDLSYLAEHLNMKASRARQRR
jgi:hypothetical protein